MYKSIWQGWKHQVLGAVSKQIKTTNGIHKSHCAMGFLVEHSGLALVSNQTLAEEHFTVCQKNAILRVANYITEHVAVPIYYERICKPILPPVPVIGNPKLGFGSLMSWYSNKMEIEIVATSVLERFNRPSPFGPNQEMSQFEKAREIIVYANDHFKFTPEQFIEIDIASQIELDMKELSKVNVEENNADSDREASRNTSATIQNIEKDLCIS